jgi:hypothetical protein
LPWSVLLNAAAAVGAVLVPKVRALLVVPLVGVTLLIAPTAYDLSS